MVIQDYFDNVFSYAFGVEKWIKDYFNEVGFNSEYTFASDLAMVDWYEDKDEVKKTYNTIKNNWITSYKAFTEVVMCINLLSWANDKLKQQGFDDRDKWVDFYSELYYKARDDFYEKWGDNDEACSYFFTCTD